MANAQTQVEKARQAARAFMQGVVGMDEAKETLVDLGGLTFIAYLDELDAEGHKIYDISSAEVVAALVTALDAVNAVLDANSGAHRKALRKLL
jgi:hypothetical protein